MSLVQQAQIPTLALLYAVKKLAYAGQPLYTASNALNTKVGLIRTDITTLELPNGAIVNAANKRLLGGGGVDGAIHRAAGPGLFQECRDLGGADTGESKITDAYRLPCKKVIHTVGPIYGLHENPHELLSSCYENSLKLAVESGLDSIAFAAISTGIYGYPSLKAAHIALKTVRTFLESDEGQKLDLVVFCNFEQKDEDAYHELVPLYFPPVEKSRTSDTSKKELEAEATAVKDDTEKVESIAADEVRIPDEAKTLDGTTEAIKTELNTAEGGKADEAKAGSSKVEESEAEKAKASDAKAKEEADGEWVKV